MFSGLILLLGLTLVGLAILAIYVQDGPGNRK